MLLPATNVTRLRIIKNMKLLGRPVALKIEAALQKRLQESPDRERPPKLAALLVGDHAPSKSYLAMKKQACQRVGIVSTLDILPGATSQKELEEKIQELNHDPSVDGILLQFPLPKHLPAETIVESISPQKDVDGFTPTNLGKLFSDQSDGFIPCTPAGILALLEAYDISLEGKHVVIVGRSRIVGRPLALLLARNTTHCNATVTLAHSKTSHLSSLTKQADILIAATGVPHFFNEEMVREGSVVIDVGITRVEDLNHPKGYRLVGDVDPIAVAPKVSALTPVPGGVGPLTVAMLLQNTCESYWRSFSS